MAECELCGKETILYDAIVEGSLVKVCSECARYGKVVVVEPKRVEEVERIRVRLPEENVEEYVVEDYAKRIKEARENLKLTQEELAKKIHEKESVIHKLEAGTLTPNLELAKKLEIVLKIKLIEGYKGDYSRGKLDFKNTALTIGDLLELKKEKGI
ncbi:MAG: multiprotein bridging factor aMBF1 [Nanoarchaeota archaeon]